MTEPMPLYRLADELAPPAPVLIVALEGWVDAGLAGATAMAALLEGIDTRPYARFDSEELLDQRARRPKLRIVDGINDDLEWPEVTFARRNRRRRLRRRLIDRAGARHALEEFFR